MAPSSIVAPAGCTLVDEALGPGDDPHITGQRLAARLLANLGATLGYEGTRPIAVGAHARISIAHTKTRVVAIAGAVAQLGIDLVDDSDRARIARIAPRFLAAGDDVVARFAATEAALKALGLGLLEGMFDRELRIEMSLVPPRITIDRAELALVLGRLGSSTVAIAYG